MREQTKIMVLLMSVIIIAVISLLFVFYYYSKIQTHMTTKMFDQTPLRGIDNEPLFVLPPKIQEQSCSKPNCYYNHSYRIGPDVFETGPHDKDGIPIKGCHPEGTILTVTIQTATNVVQKLKCTNGGWTTLS